MPWEPQFGWLGIIIVWAVVATIFTLLYHSFANRNRRR